MDVIFYMYTCVMGMSEQGFWESPLRKILKMLDIHEDFVAVKRAAVSQEEYESRYFNNGQDYATEIHSMHEVEGWD